MVHRSAAPGDVASGMSEPASVRLATPPIGLWVDTKQIFALRAPRTCFQMGDYAGVVKLAGLPWLFEQGDVFAKMSRGGVCVRSRTEKGGY